MALQYFTFLGAENVLALGHLAYFNSNRNNGYDF